MQAIERRITREFVRRAGPSEPVDDAAIFNAITTTQSPKWRVQSMFSATKFLVAGAIVALFGGFLLIAQPSDPGGNTPPGAATDAEEAVASPETTWVTGTVSWRGRDVGSVETSIDDGVTRRYGYHWADQGTLGLSDPRLVGTMSVTNNQDTHRLTDDTGCSSSQAEDRSEVPPCVFTVHSGTTRIVNDEGSWEGTTLALARGHRNAGGTISDTIIFTGSGAYEGLTAYLVFDGSQHPVPTVGVIFPGEMPPVATFE